MPKRKRLKIKGIVQGVGFRPFVYRLANELNLKGFVRNTSAGVDIEIEGSEHNIKKFSQLLTAKKPPPARIDHISGIYIPIKKEKRFIIKESKVSKGFTQISPDIATCKDCLREMYDPEDRRYKFPFINCTNCGPRYSIILNTPYDRKKTTMRKFKMCPDCAREFIDINNRRFHAQPDCCAVCGPHFSLYQVNRKRVDITDPISETAKLIKKGNIVAIKGIGGFHIACDATNCAVVRRLRRLKNRPTKPFAIMVRNQDLEKIVILSQQEKRLLNSPVAPIMLLKKKRKIICDEVAPKNPYLGVMLPYAPIHHLLLDEVPYLVMTSANIQDEPIIKSEAEVAERLKNIISFYLTHNREIENRADDSIGFYLPHYGFSIIRRSRGYAPIPIDLPFPVQPTLAVGPYLKNTFTLAHRQDAYISPHIGDLDNLKTLYFFNEMVKKYRRWFKIQPGIIAYDLHPDYLSTKIAQQLPGKKVAVQHHIAHIVSCMGENMISGPVIGIAFDGTGYGLDGRIWGGEFFVGDLKAQKRVAHLEYLPLPGGESSIKKPYRIAIAYIYKLLRKTIKGLYYPETNLIKNMIDHNRNLIYTSSMGRLFDCVSALLDITKEITYEAEAAINLEYTARKGVRTYYPFTITGGAEMIIRVEDILEGILKDLKKGIKKEIISAKFHNTIVRFSLEIVRKLSRIYHMKKVCLSGGVFQNRYLLQLMIKTLESEGFEVYIHRKLPTNDGCISYGQVIIANSQQK